MTLQQAKVAQVSDLAPGEMKQVSVGDTEILLARYKDEFFATAAHCTHYGAPLVDGVLHGKRVVCPWHHACFDVTNGDHIEPPGCDSLPSFAVSVDGEEVYVTVPEDAATQRTPQMQNRDQTNQKLYLIVGGGTAAQYAAEAMRTEGFSGKILMITPEDETPYDRVNCSKAYLQDDAPDDWMPLRPPEFYQEHDIEIMHGVKVDELDVDKKEALLSNGDTIHYDKVLLATGGKATAPDIPGVELDNIFTLRSMKDSKRIKELVKQNKIKKAVVLGASFIGMEGAWSLSELGCEVTVIAPDEIPFAKVWGQEVGQMIQDLHKNNGINFQLNSKVTEFKGAQKVSSVVLDNGDSLPAELVLIGIGVKPATQFVKGLSLEEDGGITVDEHFQAAGDVYAAGDIAHFQYKGEKKRIEHWRVACQHGRIAGYNMAGKPEVYDSVPFFWTGQQGIKIRYVGHVKDFDDIIYDGNIEDQEFIAYYIKDGVVKAALGLNRDKEMAIIEELIRIDHMPVAASLKNPDFKLESYFSELEV